MGFKIRYQASGVWRFTARRDEHTFDITAASRRKISQDDRSSRPRR